MQMILTAARSALYGLLAKGRKRYAEKPALRLPEPSAQPRLHLPEESLPEYMNW